MFFLPVNTRYTIRGKLNDLFFAFFVIFYLLFPISISYAQDDFSDPGGQDYSSDGNVSESWVDDNNFSGDEIGSGGGGGGLSSQARDSWATDPDFGAADDVNNAAYELSQWESNPPEGITPEEWSSTYEQLQNNLSNAQAEFDSKYSHEVEQVMTVGEAGQNMSNALSPEALASVATNDRPAYYSNVINSAIPSHFHAGERAAAIGASGLDPKTAGEIAQADAISRGEGVGTQMGAYQIAYATAAGTNTTGNQVTLDAIAAVASSLDLNDPNQTNNFINAAMATAQTHGATPSDVLSALQAAGIDTGKYQEQVINAAVTHGINPGNVFSGPASNAGAAAIGQAATTGPTGASSAGTATAPAGGPAPAPVAVPEPERPTTVAPPAPAQNPVTNINTSAVRTEQDQFGNTQYTQQASFSPPGGGSYNITVVTNSQNVTTAYGQTVDASGNPGPQVTQTLTDITISPGSGINDSQAKELVSELLGISDVNKPPPPQR